MNLIDIVNKQSIIYPEIKPLLYNILRILTMQIVAQTLFTINNPSVSFMNNTFIQTTIYLCVGVSVFWMIVYKYLLSSENIII